MAKKGIIKISQKYFKPQESDKIALVAPTATLIEIKDFEVVRKNNVNIPEKIERIAKCFNPNCVTNKEGIPTKFTVLQTDGQIKLSCHYCEKKPPRRIIWCSFSFKITQSKRLSVFIDSLFWLKTIKNSSIRCFSNNL